MEAEQVEEFMPIFAQLFFETIINEQSKQVIDEFSTMLTHIMTEHKKVALKEIKNIFGPMLLNAKINTTFKAYNLLFNGTDKEQ